MSVCKVLVSEEGILIPFHEIVIISEQDVDCKIFFEYKLKTATIIDYEKVYVKDIHDQYFTISLSYNSRYIFNEHDYGFIYETETLKLKLYQDFAKIRKDGI